MRKDFPKIIYKEDLEYTESTGFYKFRGHKICGYLKNKVTKEICKGVPMANGRCRFHGGSKIKGFSKSQLKTENNLTPEDIEGDKVHLGESFRRRYEIYLKNPDIYDMNQEIAKVIVLSDMLIEKLDDNNLEHLSGKIGELIKITAGVKEKYHKIKQGYIDIVAVKIIIMQLHQIITEYMNTTRLLITDPTNIRKLESLKEITIKKISDIKLPVIKE